MTKKSKAFTKKFKKTVQLLLSEKHRNEMFKEYEQTSFVFDKWVRQYKTTGSFEEKDNRTPEQIKGIRLQKLATENDMLKQAELTMK